MSPLESSTIAASLLPRFLGLIYFHWSHPSPFGKNQSGKTFCVFAPFLLEITFYPFSVSLTPFHMDQLMRSESEWSNLLLLYNGGIFYH